MTTIESVAAGMRRIRDAYPTAAQVAASMQSSGIGRQSVGTSFWLGRASDRDDWSRGDEMMRGIPHVAAIEDNQP